MQVYKYGSIEPYQPSKPPQKPLKVISKIALQRILDDYIAFLAEVEKDSSLVNNEEFTDYLKATLKLLKTSRLSLKRGDTWTGKEPEIVALYGVVAPRKNK